VLQENARLDADELYGEQEKALSEFTRLHPMLSLEATSHTSLQMVSDLLDETTIPTRALEIVPRSYDEMYLRPPDLSIGERPCILNDRCLCVWLARWRYGDDTNMAFIGTEFLLPSQRERFLEKGDLPSTHGKCLLCSRYFTTFLYRLARSDPTFRPSDRIPVQMYQSVLGIDRGVDHPTHCSAANDADGYRSDALLFVDDEFAETQASRGKEMANFLWRPVVKFCSTHYVYVLDPEGLPRLIQQNVSAHPNPSPHFCRPASSMEVTTASAKTTRPPN